MRECLLPMHRASHVLIYLAGQECCTLYEFNVMVINVCLVVTV